MDRAAHELAERRIDHAVPRQRQLARERRATTSASKCTPSGPRTSTLASGRPCWMRSCTVVVSICGGYEAANDRQSAPVRAAATLAPARGRPDARTGANRYNGAANGTQNPAAQKSRVRRSCAFVPSSSDSVPMNAQSKPPHCRSAPDARSTARSSSAARARSSRPRRARSRCCTIASTAASCAPAS